jgi:hypothetical protein
MSAVAFQAGIGVATDDGLRANCVLPLSGARPPVTPPQTGMKLHVKKVHGVATWTWNASDDSCGICRYPFDGCCPTCKIPGDNCPLGTTTVARHFRGT